MSAPAGDKLRADGEAIKAKGDGLARITPLKFPSSPLPADDTATIAGRATAKLKENAEQVQALLKAGEAEGQRLARNLQAAGASYGKVDTASAEALEQGRPNIPEPVVPQQMPAAPPVAVPSAGGPHPEYSYQFVGTNAEQLAPSRSGSLDTFVSDWKAMKTALGRTAIEFNPPLAHWEGTAGEAAELALRNHRQWLNGMEKACDQLIKQAEKLKSAHNTAKNDHPSETTVELLVAASLMPVTGLASQVALAVMQEKSDACMTKYAGEATLEPITAEPPPHASQLPPATPNSPTKPGGPGSPSGSGGGGGGGTPPTPPQPAMPELPGGQPQPMAGGQPGGEQQGGGQQGGGSPAGGSPAGGAPPGGPPGGMPSLPDSLKDLPKLDEPGVHAASAGGGSGGGAGGGGVPKMPLQPGVGSVSVGPGPASGGVPGGGAPVGGPGGGMGGMGGGGAPMGGGHGQGAGKEKRRTPGLSPDEELYTEDRQWTEGYIGKPQRKPGVPPKDRREE